MRGRNIVLFSYGVFIYAVVAQSVEQRHGKA